MPLFQKRAVVVVQAEQFLPDTLPLPFHLVGPIVALDPEGWHVHAASGRQAIEPGDWIVREPASANLPLGAYPIKPHIFHELYYQVGD